ncbi:MAG: Crp/Fnr family transcriptional regulator [Alicyclobacillus sp. RIFOXYA1_FULL_53_8]|nr:MAG: Crp/Fnr family transcriptional regulator [Alicyclobacillus sp. RIFOXYA1_FULL_53_8]
MDVLRDFSIFKDLTPDELQGLGRIVVERRVSRGEYIFMEGQTREAVFFIRRGLIKVFKVNEEGQEHVVSILGVGKMFPHVGFFDDGPYPGTAQAIEPSTLLSVEWLQFDALLVENPSIARKVMRVMGERILQLQSKLQELAFYDSRDRVIALVRHFAEEYGQVQSDGIHVRLPLTHGEMADMIGMTRESVNRVWNRLRREGVLSGHRDEWVLHVETTNSDD